MRKTIAGERSNDVVLHPGADLVHTHRIQAAVDACSAGGGGRVVLRPGAYRAGTIILRSGVTLHLEQDAVLTASADLADYVRKEGEAIGLIFAEGADDIGLTGDGTVDGNDKAFRTQRKVIPEWVTAKKPWGTWIPAFEVGMLARPLALIVLAGCRKVRMEGIRIEGSARWTVHLLSCSDVTLRRVTVRSAVDSSNGDGFDLDGCWRVLMEECDIETGDDAICLKTTRTWGYDHPCQDIVIRRCRAFSTTHGFCIGHETQDNYENIAVSDLEIGGWGGYRTKTGIGLGIIDGATMRGVRLSNIRMTDVIAPLQIRLSNEGKTYRGHTAMAGYRDRKMHQRPAGELRDIALENVTIRGATGNSFLSGLPGHPLHDVSLRDFRVELVESVDADRIMTDVPELESEYPTDPMWRFLPAYGLFCRHIAGLAMRNISITRTVPDPRPAILLKDIQGGDIQNLSATEET